MLLAVSCTASDRADPAADEPVPTSRLSARELDAIPQWQAPVQYSTAEHDSLRLWPFAAAGFGPDAELLVGAGPDLFSFAPDGQTLRRLGRQGDGPGEYRTVFRVIPAADSTFLIADLNGRVTRIRPDGSVLGVIPRLEAGGSGRESEPVAWLGPNRIVVTWWQQRPNRGSLAGLPEGDFERDPVPLLVFDTAGRRVDSLGTWAGLERAVLPLAGGTSRIPPAFARSTVHDARGEALAIGATDSVDVTLLRDGRPVLRLLVAGEARLPSRDLESAWRRGVAEELGDAGEVVIRALAGAPRVPDLPRVGALVVDDERNVWVGDYSPPGETVRRWTVFSPAGEPIGQLDLPAMVEAFLPGRSEILDVSRGRLALLRESGAGERFIEVRTIVRPGLEKELPAFRRVALAVGSAHAAQNANRPITVSTRGHLAFVRSRRQVEPLLTVVDSAGRLVSEFGRPGGGPGELSGSLELRFADTTLVVVDLDQARISHFTPHGRFLGGRRIPAGARPLAIVRDSIDLLTRTREGRAEIVRLPWRDGAGRTVVPATDSFLPHATSGNRSAGQDVPPYAADGSRVAIAEPKGYFIATYHSRAARSSMASRRELEPRRRTTRELEEASARIRRLMRSGMPGPSGGRVAIGGLEERLDSLPKQVLPHFSRHGLGYDARGRLLVIGEASDSTFVDAFADTAFLGRQMLPCTGHYASVSLNGEWLALLCTTDAAKGPPAEIQLYRLEDAP